MARTPPFSAKVIAQFEAAIVKALNADEINADDEIAAKKCSGKYCLGLVNVVKKGAKDLGVNLKCQKSKCSWVLEGKDWKRICTLDCTGGGLTINGEITQD
jgi:hypothetical protein